jgi:hypothetical protein
MLTRAVGADGKITVNAYVGEVVRLLADRRRVIHNLVPPPFGKAFHSVEE